jgi:CubicO group peptidase (beta-lactamase class C family)
MTDLEGTIDRIAEETGFSGGVRVDQGDDVEFLKAYGFAHRGFEIANAVDTRFGIGSGTKGLTALTVMSLIAEGRLEVTTTARSMLGEDLPLIDDAVTVEHLLAHRSGIGDYYDEEIVHEPLDYVSPVPVSELGATEDYLRALDGFETKFPPDERFSYSNGGYVVLALIAERTSGTPFHELVVHRVCETAGMVDTEFRRSDELPGRTALGYLAEDGPRTNVFRLPVRGSGDDGIYPTAADVSALWTALFAGRIVSMDLVAEMVRPRSEVPSPRRLRAASLLRRSRFRSGSRRSPGRSGLPRAAGSRRSTPASPTSTRSTRAATSPRGRSRSCSRPRCGPPSGRCANPGVASLRKELPQDRRQAVLRESSPASLVWARDVYADAEVGGRGT